MTVTQRSILSHMANDELDVHAIRVGYSQLQGLVEAHRTDGSLGLPDAIVALVEELLDGDSGDLFNFLFGATLFGSNMLAAVQRGDLMGKTDAEILRVAGQVANHMLELDRDPG